MHCIQMSCCSRCSCMYRVIIRYQCFRLFPRLQRWQTSWCRLSSGYTTKIYTRPAPYGPVVGPRTGALGRNSDVANAAQLFWGRGRCPVFVGPHRMSGDAFAPLRRLQAFGLTFAVPLPIRIWTTHHARFTRFKIEGIVATEFKIARRHHEEDSAIRRKVWEAIGGRGQRRVDHRRFQSDGRDARQGVFSPVY